MALRLIIPTKNPQHAHHGFILKTQFSDKKFRYKAINSYLPRIALFLATKPSTLSNNNIPIKIKTGVLPWLT